MGGGVTSSEGRRKQWRHTPQEKEGSGSVPLVPQEKEGSGGVPLLRKRQYCCGGGAEPDLCLPNPELLSDPSLLSLLTPRLRDKLREIMRLAAGHTASIAGWS